MKKIIYFIIIASTITFTSCSSDDDAVEKEEQDKIIGKWTLFQEFESNEEIVLTECRKRSTVEFKLDGSFIHEDLIESGDLCESEGVQTGSWANKGSGMYDLTIDGETDTAKITFEDDTFYWVDEEDKIVYKKQ